MIKTILVSDNDPSTNSIFEFILQQAGYSVLTATSKTECLKQFESDKKIDLVLLDITDPTNLDTFRNLQKINPNLIVLVMTTHAITDTLKTAMDLGAYGVVYKPFDVEEILIIIETIIKGIPSPTQK